MFKKKGVICRFKIPAAQPCCNKRTDVWTQHHHHYNETTNSGLTGCCSVNATLLWHSVNNSWTFKAKQDSCLFLGHAAVLCDTVEVLLLCPLPKPAYKGFFFGGGGQKTALFKALNQCNNIQSLLHWWENGWEWHFSTEGLCLRCSESFGSAVTRLVILQKTLLSFWFYKTLLSAHHILLIRVFLWLFSRPL